MAKVIVTKYLAPTNTLGARIKARSEDGTRVSTWHHHGDAAENHRFAAEVLAHKLGWSGALTGGEHPDGKGYCFVVA